MRQACALCACVCFVAVVWFIGAPVLRLFFCIGCLFHSVCFPLVERCLRAFSLFAASQCFLIRRCLLLGSLCLFLLPCTRFPLFCSVPPRFQAHALCVLGSGTAHTRTLPEAASSPTVIIFVLVFFGGVFSLISPSIADTPTYIISRAHLCVCVCVSCVLAPLMRAKQTERDPTDKQEREGRPVVEAVAAFLLPRS